MSPFGLGKPHFSINLSLENFFICKLVWISQFFSSYTTGLTLKPNTPLSWCYPKSLPLVKCIKLIFKEHMIRKRYIFLIYRNYWINNRSGKYDLLAWSKRKTSQSILPMYFYIYIKFEIYCLYNSRDTPIFCKMEFLPRREILHK